MVGEYLVVALAGVAFIGAMWAVYKGVQYAWRINQLLAVGMLFALFTPLTVFAVLLFAVFAVAEVRWEREVRSAGEVRNEVRSADEVRANIRVPAPRRAGDESDMSDKS